MIRTAALLLLLSAVPALAQVPAEALPHDLSPWGMFMAADVVVKAVMIGLAVASVVTWTVALFKLVEFAVAMSTVRRSQRLVAASGALPAAARSVATRRDPVARMLRAATRSRGCCAPRGARSRARPRSSPPPAMPA